MDQAVAVDPAAEAAADQVDHRQSHRCRDQASQEGQARREAREWESPL